jgi:nitroimidazol reductase NimA-like FMN-containing flavoprotein (pyridoxamine 5'-phosphate oxidase superfamily)
MNLLQTSAWDVLPHNECIVGLQSQRIGRIALSVDALPAVLPVYFVLDGTAVVFRTRSGSVLDRHCRNTVVAFEVDSHDAARREGWSVMLVGTANVLGVGAELVALTADLDRIGAPVGDVVIRIEPGSLTGRALSPPTV